MQQYNILYKHFKLRIFVKLYQERLPALQTPRRLVGPPIECRHHPNLNLRVTWTVGDRHPFPGCLRSGILWLNWWVPLAPEFQCCYFCESSWLSYLSFSC